MQELATQWESAGDRRAEFLQCYTLMTANMLAGIEAGDFCDAAWVAGLLDHFAEYYFVALADYEEDSAGTPAPWRLAHDAARQDHALVVQNLLLGINAHVNYDLVLAVVDMLDADWSHLPMAQREVRYEDYTRVNHIIARTVDSVQNQIVERAAPVMKVLDAALGPADEWLASSLVSHWREHVWRRAVEMLDVEDMAERAALRRQVEAEASQRARAILTGQQLSALL